MQKAVQILLVEDDDDDADLAQRALRENGLANDLVRLEDGQQALDFLFALGAYAGRDVAHTPRMILLDLKLPRVDGKEVLKLIRADERTKLIPVVVMTSSHEDRDIIESYRLGVNSYIVKPVDFEKFTKVVTEIGLYWLVVNTCPPSKA